MMRAAHVGELQATEQLYSSTEMDCADAKAQTAQIIAEMEAKIVAVHAAYASELSSLEQLQERQHQDCYDVRAQTAQVTAEMEVEMEAVQAAHAAELRSLEQLQLKLELQSKIATDENTMLKEAIRAAGENSLHEQLVWHADTQTSLATLCGEIVASSAQRR